MTPEQSQAVTLREKGLSRAEIARTMGKSEKAVKSLLERARKWIDAPSALQVAAEHIGADTPAAMTWTKTDAEGNVVGRSTLHSASKGSTSEDISRLVSDILQSEVVVQAPAVNKVSAGSGHNLLIIDAADIHYGKMALVPETGNKYDQTIAAERMITGVESLIEKASHHGIDRILFVVGNDVLHIDNRTGTTSGTTQDSDGSLFSMFRGAALATTTAIYTSSKSAPVDLLHCPSNHDFYMGWACMQAVAAKLQDNPNVTATEYNMSERHRKYYGYGRSGLQFTHGDGAKEEMLLPLFRKEAPELLSNCDFLYSINHHLHHKIAKNRGNKRVEQTEKDGISITMHNKHVAIEEHDSLLKVEHVRSPSGTDGWHDRNGYVSRQAVEVFMHNEFDGQFARFTQWF